MLVDQDDIWICGIKGKGGGVKEARWLSVSSGKGPSRVRKVRGFALNKLSWPVVLHHGNGYLRGTEQERRGSFTSQSWTVPGDCHPQTFRSHWGDALARDLLLSEEYEGYTVERPNKKGK